MKIKRINNNIFWNGIRFSLISEEDTHIVISMSINEKNTIVRKVKKCLHCLECVAGKYYHCPKELNEYVIGNKNERQAFSKLLTCDGKVELIEYGEFAYDYGDISGYQEIVEIFGNIDWFGLLIGFETAIGEETIRIFM